jgi:hypothetical protein
MHGIFCLNSFGDYTDIQCLPDFVATIANIIPYFVEFVQYLQKTYENRISFPVNFSKLHLEFVCKIFKCP